MFMPLQDPDWDRMVIRYFLAAVRDFSRLPLPETAAMRAEREQYERRRRHWYWRRWWNLECWWDDTRTQRRQILAWRPWYVAFDATDWLDEWLYDQMDAFPQRLIRAERLWFRTRERVRLRWRKWLR